MTSQTTGPLVRMNLRPYVCQAREVARRELLLDPPYQRGSMWSVDQQVALVRSWLLGLPVGAVVLNDRTTTDWTTRNGGVRAEVYAVVDGRQRIETAQAWFFGDLAVPASWFPSVDVLTTHPTHDGPYVTYAGLSDSARRHVAFSCSLPVIETSVLTVQAEAEIFLLVNSGGTRQTPADLANALAHAKPSAH
jgi:hypothetical protein